MAAVTEAPPVPPVEDTVDGGADPRFDGDTEQVLDDQVPEETPTDQESDDAVNGSKSTGKGPAVESDGVPATRLAAVVGGLVLVVVVAAMWVVSPLLALLLAAGAVLAAAAAWVGAWMWKRRGKNRGRPAGKREWSLKWGRDGRRAGGAGRGQAGLRGLLGGRKNTAGGGRKNGTGAGGRGKRGRLWPFGGGRKKGSGSGRTATGARSGGLGRSAKGKPFAGLLGSRKNTAGGGRRPGAGGGRSGRLGRLGGKSWRPGGGKSGAPKASRHGSVGTSKRRARRPRGWGKTVANWTRRAWGTWPDELVNDQRKPGETKDDTKKPTGQEKQANEANDEKKGEGDNPQGTRVKQEPGGHREGVVIDGEVLDVKDESTADEPTPERPQLAPVAALGGSTSTTNGQADQATHKGGNNMGTATTVNNAAMAMAEHYLDQVDNWANVKVAETLRGVAESAERDAVTFEEKADGLRSLAARLEDIDSGQAVELLRRAEAQSHEAELRYGAARCLRDQADAYESQG